MLTTGPEHAGEDQARTERHAAFDEEALACLPALRRYALHLSGTVMDAEDLVQDAYLRALRSWHQYAPGTHMLAWLRTILYRNFVTQFRAGRYLVPMPSDETDRSAAPQDPLLATELCVALAALTPTLRQSVWLSDWEGFGDDEIAAIAGIPVGTAKSRLSRARHQLRRAMQVAGQERGFPSARLRGKGEPDDQGRISESA